MNINNVWHLKDFVFKFFLIAIMLCAINAMAIKLDVPDEEEPLPMAVEYLRFGNKPGYGSGCLTNLYTGISDHEQTAGWIKIYKDPAYSDKVCFVAKPFTANSSEKRQDKVLEFTVSTTNELCRAEMNYVFHCEWDETADDEYGAEDHEAPYCIRLNLDEERECSILPKHNGYRNVLEKDQDVFFIEANGNSGFCFEIKNENLTAPHLKCELCTDNNDWIEAKKKVNLLSIKGKDINKLRVYYTNAFATVDKIFLRFTTSTDYSEPFKYTIKARNVRPLFLVHGIESVPTEEQDKYNDSGETAFWGIYSKISAWDDLNPTIPFPFPWNSGVGKYIDYCKGEKSLAAFVDKKSKDWKLQPIILYSSFKFISNDLTYCKSWT